MELKDSVVLVTGANGGLGREFVRQSLERGAAKVYAAARKPQEWDDPRVVPLALDVTDPAAIRQAAAATGDVTVLVNNAGITGASSLLTSPIGEGLQSSSSNRALMRPPLSRTRTVAGALGGPRSMPPKAGSAPLACG